MIRVTGDREVIAALGRIKSVMPAVENTSGTVSAAQIAAFARARVPSGPPTGGHASSSVVAMGKEVRGGGAAFPYFPWLDFGGRVGRGNSISRPFMKTGRYIWRGYVTLKPQVEDNMEHALVGAIRLTGLEVH